MAERDGTNNPSVRRLSTIRTHVTARHFLFREDERERIINFSLFPELQPSSIHKDCCLSTKINDDTFNQRFDYVRNIHDACGYLGISYHASSIPGFHKI